jgi:hypothetical protein
MPNTIRCPKATATCAIARGITQSLGIQIPAPRKGYSTDLNELGIQAGEGGVLLRG